MDLNPFFSGRITEVIATTAGEGGECHGAPMGIRRDGDTYHIQMFSNTVTSENALRSRRLCANFTCDAARWIRAVTGGFTAEDFESPPGWDAPALSGAHARVLFECVPADVDRLELRTLDAWRADGMVPQVNRGFNALIEAAVLFTRRDFVEPAEFDERFAELRRLGHSCGDSSVIDAFDTISGLISK